MPPLIDLPDVGKRIAHGQVTPTTATETVVTGLSLVDDCWVSLEADPTLTMMWVSADKGDQAGSPAAGSLIVQSTKPTGAADVTVLASTTPWGVVNWIAVGNP